MPIGYFQSGSLLFQTLSCCHAQFLASAWIFPSELRVRHIQRMATDLAPMDKPPTGAWRQTASTCRFACDPCAVREFNNTRPRSWSSLSARGYHPSIGVILSSYFTDLTTVDYLPPSKSECPQPDIAFPSPRISISRNEIWMTNFITNQKFQ
jgi:hypothetical protein